jgi:hypothetical protein
MSDDSWLTYEVPYGKPPKKPAPAEISGLIFWPVVLLAGVVVVVGLLLGLSRFSSLAQKSVTDHMTQEAIAQYQIVEQGTDLLRKSLAAGVVAEAYLMAKDSDNYHKWKQISEQWNDLFEKQIEAETRQQIQRFTR